MSDFTPKERAGLEAIARDIASICPRCGRGTLHERRAMNSLSRVDRKTYICSSCGTAEAMEDYSRHPDSPMTKDEWAIRE